jgi:hypothetical protein
MKEAIKNRLQSRRGCNSIHYPQNKNCIFNTKKDFYFIKNRSQLSQSQFLK